MSEVSARFILLVRTCQFQSTPSQIIRAIREIRGQIYQPQISPYAQQEHELLIMPELIHHELSESIIGSAMKVLNTLRPGLDEKLYENALVIELQNRGHRVEQQRHFPVHYDGQLIGSLIPEM